jgi:hypothetical protein
MVVGTGNVQQPDKTDSESWNPHLAARIRGRQERPPSHYQTELESDPVDAINECKVKGDNLTSYRQFQTITAEVWSSGPVVPPSVDLDWIGDS